MDSTLSPAWVGSLTFSPRHWSATPTEHTFLINVTNYSALRLDHTWSATSASADFSTFVVTILEDCQDLTG